MRVLSGNEKNILIFSVSSHLEVRNNSLDSSCNTLNAQINQFMMLTKLMLTIIRMKLKLLTNV